MFRPRTALLAGALLLVGAALLVSLVGRTVKRSQARYRAPLVIAVHAFYPGALARDVAATVAAPIEEQVGGVEGMLSMSSQSANDGSYTLHVRFEAGSDLDMALVLVQNRVSMAMPVLPAVVNQEGVSVKKLSPEPLFLVALTAPGGRYDDHYLSKYATTNVKDELARLPGVGDVVLFGRGANGTRVPPDNVGAHARLNGKPAAVLGIHALPNARPGDVRREVLGKVAELHARAPEGVALTVPFDFAANLGQPHDPATGEHLVVDGEMPDGAPAERTAQTLDRAAGLVRQTPGVRDVLALSEHPFSLVRKRPCLVVGLAPKDQRESGRDRIAAEVRAALGEQIPGAVFRVSEPSTAGRYPVYGFPIDFVVEDRGDCGAEELRRCAEALVAKMSRDGTFSDVGVGPGLRGVPLLYVDIDRARCLALGLEVTDVCRTLQNYLGPVSVNQFGRTVQMNVRADPHLRGQSSAVVKLLVKNKQNQAVPLRAVLSVREASGPRVVGRHNGCPAARVTANLAEGASLAGARSLCETWARQELGTKLRLVWETR
jgi:multidrug efflux pump subunit AcrB